MSEAKIKTVCCECGALIHDGPTTIEGEVSHGLCLRCYAAIMAFLEGEEK